MPSYFKFKLLGEGTYAVVYLAKKIEYAGSKIVKEDPGRGKPYVAIKKIKRTQYGFGVEISAIREMRTLKLIKHPYIVNIEDVFLHKGSIHMILEYVEFDLEKIIRCRELILVPGNIKGWMAMLLEALVECHRRGIVHRDIKPGNLLITGNGTLKLADFGLARRVGNEMTKQVVTRWYRSPEILLGAVRHGAPADMWSVGAVLAEMLLRVPFFPGDSDMAQLNLIFKVLGTPLVSDWPDMMALPGYSEFRPVQGVCLSRIFTGASDDTLDIIRSFLTFDPLKRISAADALKHEWFTNYPAPSVLGEFPLPPQSTCTVSKPDLDEKAVLQNSSPTENEVIEG